MKEACLENEGLLEMITEKAKNITTCFKVHSEKIRFMGSIPNLEKGDYI
jgi:hypothetical protein